MAKRISILGTGSWGTALGATLVQNGHHASLIGRNKKTLEDINTRHLNSHYLPGIDLPPTLTASADFETIEQADLILFVVPTSATRETAEKLTKLNIPQSTILVSCAKGIERNTGERMSEIIAEHFPNHPLAALSGPNHAEEVARGLATCAVIGSDNHNTAVCLQELLNNQFFRTYTSEDIAGIEVGGAIKNVFAISAGIAVGIGLGDNAIAALATRGLAEMTRLGTAMGGKTETFMGLSGMGDLIATCSSTHSRNNKVGRLLGQGKTVQEAVDSLGMVAEGVPNTLSIYETAQKIGCRTPLIDAVYSILYQDKAAPAALQELFARSPRPEAD